VFSDDVLPGQSLKKLHEYLLFAVDNDGRQQSAAGDKRKKRLVVHVRSETSRGGNDFVTLFFVNWVAMDFW
jgi:hypothetical protein